MTYQLIRGDATSLPLADDSVDLIVTSPPYFALRSYTDGGEHYDGQIGSEDTPQAYLEAMWGWTAECRRVLKPSGSMFVNLGDKIENKSLMGLPWRYAIGCIDQLDLILRAEVIWAKPNGLPESVTDRVRRSHEQWFHFTKEPRYFSAVDEIREEYAPGTAERYASGYRPEHESYSAGGPTSNGPARHDGGGPAGCNPLGKLPGSVWEIPTEPLRVPDHLGVDHFAAFPSEWPRRLILGWSPGPSTTGRPSSSSPSGVCVECGEGRRPVYEDRGLSTYARLKMEGRLRQGSDADTPPSSVPGTTGQTRDEGGKRATYEAKPKELTGYACACPTTDAPTRPAVILDPFCGTGTVPAVAHALGRHGIGIDLSADYLRLAEWRCNDPALRAKVLRVDKPPAQVEGQASLFGDSA